MTYLIAIALAAAATQTGGGCYETQGRVHCLNPPPATPLTESQERAIDARIMAEDQNILAPLAAGINNSSCEAATQNARTAARLDLVAVIGRRCRR